jgi:hypothetical protein
VPDERHARDVAKLEQRIVDLPPLALCAVERFLERADVDGPPEDVDVRKVLVVEQRLEQRAESGGVVAVGRLQIGVDVGPLARRSAGAQ